MRSAENPDVVVVGAGLAGLSLALALAGEGMEVAVLEAWSEPAPFSEDKELNSWDPRVSALTPTSTAWLDGLGVWPAIEAGRVGPYTRMSVWDGAGTGQINFTARDLDVPLLGHIVENRVTVRALLEAVRGRANIRLHWGAGVESADFTAGEGAVVHTADGLRWHAPLVIGADGARSRTRELAALPTRAWSYNQHAIVTTVQLAQPHQQTCFQAFLDTGPLALLPLSESHLCSIVWSLDDGCWEPLQACNDADFVLAMNRALDTEAPTVQGVAERAVFPLRQCHAIDYVRDGCALVGDAAHSIHPLAGQGINLGLKDARVLSEEVCAAWRDGLPLGQLAALRRYQRRRKTDNLLMMSAMEGFKRGFGSRNPAIRVARNMGLSWVDGAKPLKNWLAREALA